MKKIIKKIIAIFSVLCFSLVLFPLTSILNVAASDYYYITYPNGTRAPSGSLREGCAYGIYGIISYYKHDREVTRISANIIDANGYVDLDHSYSKDFSYAEFLIDYDSTYDLHQEFNDNIIFNTLPIGDYKWQVIVEDVYFDDKGKAHYDDVQTTIIEETTFSIISNNTTSSMKINGKTEPSGRLEPGKFFAVKGMIYSNLPITRVWGGVYNRDWTATAQWTEASPGTTTYDLSKHFDNNIIFNNLDVGYYYYRIEATDDSGNVYPLCNSEFQIGDPPPIVWYNGLSPVDFGDSFDSLLLAKEPWITIRSNTDSNVILHTEEWEPCEMWRFTRQSDGSYTIQNFANGKYLDAEGLGTTNGTNVFTCEGNGGENQKWFFYELNGGYVVRAAYSDMVLDVNGGVWDSGTNIHMYEKNDTAAQTFSLCYSGTNYGITGKGELSATVSDNTITLNIFHSTYADGYELYRSTNNKDFEKIADTTMGTYVDKSLKYGQTYYYKVRYSNRFYNTIESDVISATTESKWFNELKPVNLGEQFDSTIIVKGQNYALISDEKENAVIYKQDGTTAEMWRFTRQSDGSYKIQNFANQKALDAYDSQTANGTNVTTHKSHSGENQKWFIYALNGGYVIRAAYTDKVLDVSDGLFQNSSNIQLYEKNDTDSQVFELYDGKSTEYGKPQVDPITAYVRGTSVILTLNTPSYVDTVKIYRSYDKKNYEIIGETTEGTFKDEELDDNQKYYYKAEYINNFYAVESPVIYAITGNEFVDGDVNGDNDFSIADIVAFQNWLLGRSDANLVNWKAADLCEDGKLNVFDLCLLRRKLIYG